MPWKECHVMDERVRFVARLLDGEKVQHEVVKRGIEVAVPLVRPAIRRGAKMRRSLPELS